MNWREGLSGNWAIRTARWRLFSISCSDSNFGMGRLEFALRSFLARCFATDSLRTQSVSESAPPRIAMRKMWTEYRVERVISFVCSISIVSLYRVGML